MASEIELSKRGRELITAALEALADPEGAEFIASNYRDALELLDLIDQRAPLPGWALGYLDDIARVISSDIRHKLQITRSDLHDLQTLDNIRERIAAAVLG